jgi:glycosyltransferase involved in cell wall biosynthesis
MSARVTVCVIGTPGRAAFADAMLLGIHGGLWKNGIKSHLFLLDKDEDAESIPAYFTEEKTDPESFFIIDINGNYNLTPLAGRPARMRFSFLIDHPYFHAGKFAGYPHPMTVGVVDATHMTALADRGMKTPVVFLPHAGPDPELAPRPMKERDIDLLFCGNISPLVIGDVFKDRLAALEKGAQGVVLDAIDHVLEEGRDIHSALKEAVAGRGLTLSGFSLDDLRVIITMVKAFAAGKLRLEYLSRLIALSGPAIHMVGDLEGILGQGSGVEPGPGVVFHGSLPFTEVKAMMRRTKISVNANFTIAGGSHERIWQGMAVGCLTLTNESYFMRANFEENRNILFFPRRAEEMAETVCRALADSDRLQEMTNSAHEIYAAGHTWEKRVKAILDVFERSL